MTAAQTAKAIHKSPRFVRDLIADKKLKAVRITQRGHWLVFTDSLSALLGVKAPRQHSQEYYMKKDREILERMRIK